MKMQKILRLSLLLLPLTLGLVAPVNMAYAADEETFTLNLKDADIDALISTVAKKTGKNFVIDPRVKAKVTVISNKEMNANELYSVFLSVLQVHGYSVVPAGDIIKILPDVNAKQGPVPTVSGKRRLGDELVTQVIPIRNVAASQLVPILRPLVPQQGHLAAYAGSNIIVLTDRASNIARLAGIINRIDRPDNDEIEFIKLEHASSTEVVRILNSMQQKQGSQGGSPDAPKLASDDRTNSVLVSGSKAARARMRALIASLDTPLEQGGNTKVVYLKYAKAKEMADILKGVNEGQKKASKASGGKTTAAPSAASKEIDIQADEETNALVITAAPDAMKNIESVIRQLDIRRAQVHVEAIIVEVSGDVNKELGFSYLFGKEIGQPGDTSSTPPVGGALLGSAGDSLSSIGNAIASGDATAASGALGTGFTLGFGSESSNGNIFAGIFKAVASNSNSNILSTPSIVTLDNEEAEITVGESRPFATGSFTTSSSGGSNPFSTTEQKDVGLKLKIKPQINEGDTIRLDIEQETSSVDTAASEASAAAGAPGTVTNKRTIKTSVLIEDGQLIVLGGLIQDSKAKSISKIPLLGDIPLLGRLFQYRSNKNIKTNLMVFLHPTIIRDRVSADRKSQEKYTLMRAKQLEAGHAAKILDVDTSMLPELNVYFTDKVAEPVKLEEPVAELEKAPAVDAESIETLNPEVVEAEADAS